MKREQATSKDIANQFKEQGNEKFKLGMYSEAISLYDQAIQNFEENATYWLNRAIARTKLEQWKYAERDSRKALNFDEDNPKAFYYLGLSLVKRTKYEEGIKKLMKSLTIIDGNPSDTKFHRMKKEVQRELIKARYETYMEGEESLLNQLQISIAALKESKICDTNESKTNIDLVIGKLERDMKEIQTKEVPEHLCCPITLGLMHDPVITKSGITYERTALMQSIRAKGEDPVTRQTITSKDLTSNLVARKATDSYLELNPWAFKEFGMDVTDTD